MVREIPGDRSAWLIDVIRKYARTAENSLHNVGAISKDGHDKNICRPYTSIQGREYSVRNFDIDTTPCGLCQTGVPCESKIPGEVSSGFQVPGKR